MRMKNTRRLWQRINNLITHTYILGISWLIRHIYKYIIITTTVKIKLVLFRKPETRINTGLLIVDSDKILFNSDKIIADTDHKDKNTGLFIH